MSIWKQVKHITTFELGRNVLTPLLSILFAGALLIVFIDQQSFQQSIVMDIVFLALFSGGFTFFVKTNSFRSQDMDEALHFSDQIMFLQQFPAAHQAIITSRILIHNVYNIVIQLFFIVPLYLLSPVFHALMSTQTFSVCVILWISFGVYASGWTAADEAGKVVNNRSFAKSMALIGLMGIILFILYRFTSFSVIGGSIYVATHWPLLTCIAAVIIASSGVMYGKRKMKRMLQTTDYL